MTCVDVVSYSLGLREQSAGIDQLMFLDSSTFHSARYQWISGFNVDLDVSLGNPSLRVCIVLRSAVYTQTEAVVLRQSLKKEVIPCLPTSTLRLSCLSFEKASDTG